MGRLFELGLGFMWLRNGGPRRTGLVLNDCRLCTGSFEAVYATGPATASGGNCQGWTRGCGVCDGDHWYAEVGRSDRTSDDWSTAGSSFCGSCYLCCFED